MVSGIGIEYRAPRGAHSLVGKRVPDVALAGGEGEPSRVYEALRSGRFVLVTGDGRPAGWSDRLDVVAPADPAATTMLVRPDGYVAWAADAPDPSGRDAALHRWLGAP
jgi:hypothetical protein